MHSLLHFPRRYIPRRERCKHKPEEGLIYGRNPTGAYSRETLWKREQMGRIREREDGFKVKEEI